MLEVSVVVVVVDGGGELGVDIVVVVDGAVLGVFIVLPGVALFVVPGTLGVGLVALPRVLPWSPEDDDELVPDDDEPVVCA